MRAYSRSHFLARSNRSDLQAQAPIDPLHQVMAQGLEMDTPDKRLEDALRQQYWDRHSASTCAVLIGVVALSTFASPMPWLSLAGCVLGGFLFQAAVQLEARRKHGWALSFVLLSLAFGIGGMSIGGILKGPLFWVQGIGSFFAANCGAKVIYDNSREPPS